MASVASGKVTIDITGTILTFTDTGAYGTIVSRTLVIKDYNGVILATINMGAALTANYTISSDGYYTFILTVVDNTGTYPVTVNYLAQGIYTATFLSVLANSNCGCNISFCNVEKGEIFLAAANRFATSAQGVAAQTNVQAANVYINM